jgi:arabinogalactan oligomer/maltooligosaccharide transport system permease protein
MFTAGAVLVSIPIVALFISMQRFYVEGITGGSVKG